MGRPWEAQLVLQVSHTIYYKGDTGPFLEVPNGNWGPVFSSVKNGWIACWDQTNQKKDHSYVLNLHHHTHTWIMGLVCLKIG